jgi:hypothetical protein
MEALKKARSAIRKRAREPKAQLFGISAELELIAAAFDEIERAVNVLAAVDIGRHYGQRMSEDEWNVVRALAPPPEGVKHEGHCMCAACTTEAMKRLDAMMRTLGT